MGIGAKMEELFQKSQYLFLGATVANELAILERTQHVPRNYNYLEILHGNYTHKTYLENHLQLTDQNAMLPPVAGQLFKELLRTHQALRVAHAYYSSVHQDLLFMRKISNWDNTVFFMHEVNVMQDHYTMLDQLLLKWSTLNVKLSQLLDFKPIILLWEETKKVIDYLEIVDVTTYTAFQLHFFDQYVNGLGIIQTHLLIVHNFLIKYNQGTTLEYNDSWKKDLQEAFVSLQSLRNILLDYSIFNKSTIKNPLAVMFMQLRYFIGSAVDILSHINVHFFTIWNATIFALPLAYENNENKPFYEQYVQNDLNTAYKGSKSKLDKNKNPTRTFNKQEYLDKVTRTLLTLTFDISLKQDVLFSNFGESLEKESISEDKEKDEIITKRTDDSINDLMELYEKKDIIVGTVKNSQKQDPDKVKELQQKVEKLQKEAEEREAKNKMFNQIVFILTTLKHTINGFKSIFAVTNQHTRQLNPIFILAHLGGVQQMDDWKYHGWADTYHTTFDILESKTKETEKINYFVQFDHPDQMIVPLEPVIINGPSLTPIKVLIKNKTIAEESLPIHNYVSTFFTYYAIHQWQLKTHQIYNDSNLQEILTFIEDWKKKPGNFIFTLLEESTRLVDIPQNPDLKATIKPRIIMPISMLSKEYLRFKDKFETTFYPFEGQFSQPFSTFSHYIQITHGLNMNMLNNISLSLANGIDEKTVRSDNANYSLHPTLTSQNGMSHLLQLYLYIRTVHKMLPEFIKTLKSWITEETINPIGLGEILISPLNGEETIITMESELKRQQEVIHTVISPEDIKSLGDFLSDNENASLKSLMCTLINECQYVET